MVAKFKHEEGQAATEGRGWRGKKLSKQNRGGGWSQPAEKKDEKKDLRNPRSIILLEKKFPKDDLTRDSSVAGQNMKRKEEGGGKPRSRAKRGAKTTSSHSEIKRKRGRDSADKAFGKEVTKPGFQDPNGAKRPYQNA